MRKRTATKFGRGKELGGFGGLKKGWNLLVLDDVFWLEGKRVMVVGSGGMFVLCGISHWASRPRLSLASLIAVS